MLKRSVFTAAALAVFLCSYATAQSQTGVPIVGTEGICDWRWMKGDFIVNDVPDEHTAILIYKHPIGWIGNAKKGDLRPRPYTAYRAIKLKTLKPHGWEFEDKVELEEIGLTMSMETDAHRTPVNIGIPGQPSVWCRTLNEITETDILELGYTKLTTRKRKTVYLKIITANDKKGVFQDITGLRQPIELKKFDRKSREKILENAG